jgi:glutaredoxin-like protein NrdH
MTKREFDKAGIIYDVVDLTTAPNKANEFKELGYMAAPIVTTDTKIWSGFRLPKIRSLIDYIKSMERTND